VYSSFSASLSSSDAWREPAKKFCGRRQLPLKAAPTQRSFPSPRKQPPPHKQISELPLKLPLKSVRFAVIGDTGTGENPEFEVAREMEAYREVVDFSFVIMLGDNIYGGDIPEDFTTARWLLMLRDHPNLPVQISANI
jgi:hypothetical protein